MDRMLVHRRLHKPPPPPPHHPSISSGFLTFYRCSVFSWGGERHHESKVSCPRTQHIDLARARPWAFQSRVWRSNYKAIMLSGGISMGWYKQMLQNELIVKVNSCTGSPYWPITARAYPGFHSMDGMLVHHR